MATPDELLAAVRAACRDAPRPEHFTNYAHCCECAEHDATLRAATTESIGLDELAHPSWDPICFITPAGFRYYLPGLARLALRREGDYLGQFLHHLQSGRVEHLTRSQAAAVLALLEYVYADADLRAMIDATPFDKYVLEDVMFMLMEATEPPAAGS